MNYDNSRTNGNNDLRIKEKLDFFMSEKVKVHVELKDRTFLNGFIEKKLKENIYWFIDDVFKDGIYLFVKDIYDVDNFKAPKKEVKG